jgi:hypothetical protein
LLHTLEHTSCKILPVGQLRFEDTPERTHEHQHFRLLDRDANPAALRSPYDFVSPRAVFHLPIVSGWSANRKLSRNGLLGSWLDWHREVGQFQDQMRGKMHGSMVVFGINPTELS